MHFLDRAVPAPAIEQPLLLLTGVQMLGGSSFLITQVRICVPV